MVINEKGLIRAMKEAYKTEGYEIVCTEQGGAKEIHIETQKWRVTCVLKYLPRKVLGMIVEHLGEIPEPEQAVQVKKKEIQTMLFTKKCDGFGGITPDDCVNPPRAVKSDISYRGGNIWQQRCGNKTLWISPALEDIMLIKTAVSCLGEKVLNITGALSSVSIKQSEPQDAEDKRVLGYLAGIQLNEWK